MDVCSVCSRHWGGDLVVTVGAMNVLTTRSEVYEQGFVVILLCQYCASLVGSQAPVTVCYVPYWD